MANILDGITGAAVESVSSLIVPEGCIMALDAGTTSVRATLFDDFGRLVASARRPLSMRCPRPGWVEQDPVEILSALVACMAEVQFRSGIHSDRIHAVGITNQRETVVVWDRGTGQPIYDAIVWQCRRTADVVDRLVEEGHAELIRERTGLVPDAYFSATKVAWILDNVEGARSAAEAGGLMCGTIDTWLVYNLTRGDVYATDYTNASRTMLFDIRRLDWDEGLCELLRVPRRMLPEARPSSGSFGAVGGDVMTWRPPILAVAGDQQASLFGHCCFEAGSAKNTYGTGCFMLMNLGPRPTPSSNGLVTTVGIAQGERVEYALEGSVFQAGSTIRWLSEGLGIVTDAAHTSDLASSVPDTGGCYVVPAFTGLGAPWWDPHARGMVCGVTLGTDRARLVRAACESMAYQTYDVLRAMEADSGHALGQLCVDGGASANDFVMQFQADLLGIEVVRSDTSETTARGAAYLAGLACSFWEDRDELRSLSEGGERFSPRMGEARREELLAGWHDAVRRATA